MRLEIMKAKALNQPVPSEFSSTNGLSYLGTSRENKVGTVRYQPSRLGSPNVSTRGTEVLLPLNLVIAPTGEKLQRRKFKMERYREKGTVRWPNQAGQEFAMKPTQFARDDKMVPLQRGFLDTPREHILNEIWSRSLRTGTRGITIQSLGGMRNYDLMTAGQMVMFDAKGVGFTGRTHATSPRE